MRILATAKGKDGYAELRGKKRGEWFQWIRTTRLGNLPKLALENTVEARVRVPGADEAPYTAEVFCTAEDGGWSIRFDPGGLTFGKLNLRLDTTRWHTYRVVIGGADAGHVQTLFVDDEEKLQFEVDAVQPDEARGSAIGLGTGWATKDTYPIRMDVDYIRWANRPFAPADEQAARANVPQGLHRKDVFWDDSYNGDRMPDAQGWKWWYDHDPRPFTRIVYARETVDLDNDRNRTALYDWHTGAGATLILRDVPKLAVKDETHAALETGTFRAGNDTFTGKLVVRAAAGIGYNWPGVTLTELGEADWSRYAAVAARLHNPTDRPQAIGFSVRDSDRNTWSRLESFAPGETRVLAARLDELRTKVLVSDVWTLTLWTRGTTVPQTFLVSPVFLVGDP